MLLVLHIFNSQLVDYPIDVSECHLTILHAEHLTNKASEVILTVHQDLSSLFYVDCQFFLLEGFSVCEHEVHFS